MGISKKLKNKVEAYNEEDLARLVRMGWEDRSSFEAIQIQFQLSPNEFVKLMRRTLPPSDFRRWRRRVFEQGQLKNEKKTGGVARRFKCSRQTVDGLTKGWK